MAFILYSAKAEVSEEQKGRLFTPVAKAAVLQDPGVPVDGKVIMSLQCPCGQEGPWHPRVQREECDQKLEQGDLLPQLSPSVTTSGVLCSILHSSSKTRKEYK